MNQTCKSDLTHCVSLHSFLFDFILSLSSCGFVVAVGIVGTVVNVNSSSDRPFVGVGKAVDRMWAKRSLLCPFAVHRLINTHKRFYGHLM